MTQADILWWICHLVLLSQLTSSDMSLAQTTPPPPCDEAAITQCMVPLQSDSTFAAVLTPSNAFNLVTLAKDGDTLCQSFSVVEPCLTPLLQACYNRPSATYSGVAWAMKTFCTSGTKVFSDFPCLSQRSFLDKVEDCQQAAGLYSNMAEICQTASTLRRCVDAHVIADCDVMAAEPFQTLSEAMLLPLRLHYGCAIEQGPGPHRIPQPPLDCGPQAADCMRHLQDLSGTSAASTSISVLLTMAPQICRAYSNLQKCVPQLQDCRQAVTSSMSEYSHLAQFCTLNITVVEQHRCLQERRTRENTELCDRGYTPTSDIDISTCRYIHQHQSCAMMAIMMSCANDTRTDISSLIEKAFAPRVRISRCTTVLAGYRERPCLDSDLLAPRFSVCMNVTGVVPSNGTADCSAFPALTRCAELAVTATCGSSAVLAARPLIERVADFAQIKSGCKAEGVNTGTRRPTSGRVQFVKDGMVAPVTVAVGFLIFCVLIAMLVVSVTYCMECRRPMKQDEEDKKSTGESKRSSKRSKRSSAAESQGAEVVRGTMDSGGQGEGGVGRGAGESALEVGEVRLQDQSIEDNSHNSWYGTN